MSGIKRWWKFTTVQSKNYQLSTFKEPQVFPYTELLAEQDMSIESIPNFRGSLPANEMLLAGGPDKLLIEAIGDGIKNTLKKDKKPLIDQIHELKQITHFVPWLIHSIVDVPDKIKNVVCWKDPRKTSYLAIAMAVLWIAGYWIPIKWLINGIAIGVLSDQAKHYSQTYHNNFL